MYRCGKKLGITVIEMIVVLAVIAVLAAVAIPSLFMFIEAGRQTNRMNVARTLYLSAQNQLTELRIMGNLQAAMDAEEGIGTPPFGTPESNVYTLLGAMPANEDDENENNVFFLTKAAGAEPEGLMARLLGPVVDRAAVLDGAIVLEINRETGVVLSAFYGDRNFNPAFWGAPGAGGWTFTYTPGVGVEADVWRSLMPVDPASGVGIRGMGPDGYAPTARARRQGYYGVDNTSRLPADMSTMSITIYDSYDDIVASYFDADGVLNPDYDLDDRFPRDISGTIISDNLLFARIGILAESVEDEFTVSIPELSGLTGYGEYSKTFLLDDLEHIYEDNLTLFIESETPAGTSVIWILDYVRGDTTQIPFKENNNIGLGNSIGARFNPTELITMRVDNISKGSSNVSFGKHPYCGIGSIGTDYNISSTRHLYNIRHIIDNSYAYDDGIVSGNPVDFSVLDGVFTQRASIDVYGSDVENFDPIIQEIKSAITPADPIGFVGTYIGNTPGEGYMISNLVVEKNSPAGLFSRIESGSTVRNLTLENPRVSGISDGSTVGAVTGVNEGLIEGAYVMYRGDGGSNLGAFTDNARISYGGTPGASGGVGGIAGELADTGVIRNSVFISDLADVHVVGDDAATTGGIVGIGSGTLENVFFLALAPLFNVTDPPLIPTPSPVINPIIGTGSIADITGEDTAYFLCGKPFRPTDNEIFVFDPNRAHYNEEQTNGIGVGDSTLDLYNMVLNNWAKNRYEDPPDVWNELTVERIIERLIYPYHYLPGQSQIVNAGNSWWPIVIDELIEYEVSIYYYEKYRIGTNEVYGFESSLQGSLTLYSENRLRDNQPIIEAGYIAMVVGSEYDPVVPNPPEGFKLFTGLWGSDLATPEYTYEPSPGDFVYAQTGFGLTSPNNADIWGYKLPFYNNGSVRGLLDLLDEENPYIPLIFAYYVETPDPADSDGVIPGVVHPLFAKAIYPLTNAPPLMGNSNYPFIIRTPWQMQNITDLNYNISISIPDPDPNPEAMLILSTDIPITDILFVQERDIDFVADRGYSSLPDANPLSRPGDGTFADLTVTGTNAVVQGVFNHSYLGRRLTTDVPVSVSNVEINFTTSPTLGIGLFARVGAEGTISSIILTDSEITGSTNVGGIAGFNSGLIELCIVRNVLITGAENVGGFAGTNSPGGTIRQSGFEDTAPTPTTGITRAQSVVGTNGSVYTGGFAGINSGTIENVYFLSMARVSDPSPVSNNGGGIVGHNVPDTGVVTSAFFYAPAPHTQGIPGTPGDPEDPGTETRIYPIVRSGDPAATKTEPIAGVPVILDTCFYLAGFRYSLDRYYLSQQNATYFNVRYNQTSEMTNPNVERFGGGRGLTTRFLEIEWLDFAYRVGFGTDDIWFQLPNIDLNYSYPALQGLPVPLRWPETDSPPRPEQVDRDEDNPWDTFTPINLRPMAPNFVNGDFASPVDNIEVDQFYTQTYIDNAIAGTGGFPSANRLPAGYRVSMPNYRHMGRDFMQFHMDVIDGWWTRPVRMNYSLPPPATNSNFFDPNKPVVANGRNDFFFPHLNVEFPGPADATDGSPTGTYSPPRRIPALPAGSIANHIHNRATIERWLLIELQEANGAGLGFMTTNNRGLSRAQTTITNGTLATTAPGGGAITQSTTVNRRMQREWINAMFTRAESDSRPTRYAELNAEIAGTLYQVLRSTANTTFFYSFYHATNGWAGLTAPGGGTWYTAPTTSGDRLSFYLSPYELSGVNPREVVTAAHARSRDDDMVLIRPCQSPRTIGTGITTAANAGISGGTSVLNPAAWNTVAYGRTNQDLPTANASGGPYCLDFHSGKYYYQPRLVSNVNEPTGDRFVRQDIPAHPSTAGGAGTPLYLYDVWIGATTNTPGNGGSRTGYGITFWSDVEYTIPVGGISEQTLAEGNLPWHSSARNRVIGYWGVEFGWKHYYGEYTVPEDYPDETEFAFRSDTGPTRAMVGNYLDEVSFKTPALLSINKFIRSADDPTGPPVSFVKPTDELIVELNIRSWGDIPADNIVIKDQLYPFTEYIEFVQSPTRPVTVNRTDEHGNNIPGGAITGFTVELVPTVLPDGTVIPGAPSTVQITLPPGTRLADGERLRVTFGINVRQFVNNPEIDGDILTLLFYFKNQAVVEYQQDRQNNRLNNRIDAYANRIYRSASNVVDVFIDPIELTKTVENIPLLAANDPNYLVNVGPFKVTLKVEDTLEGDNNITTRGMINVLIPQGFAVTNFYVDGVPVPIPESPATYTVPGTDGTVRIIRNAGGTTLISIWDVDLNSTNKDTGLEYIYEMEYVGNGIGVSFTSINANYIYQYRDNVITDPLDVMLRFPTSVVGIRAVARDDEFSMIGAGPGRFATFDIMENDNFRLNRMTDDEYDVTPEVVFTNESGVPLTVPGTYTIAGQNLTFSILGSDQILTGTNFTATLHGADQMLSFRPNVAGDYTLFYRILLDATKDGGNPALFRLSSAIPPARVDIEVIPSQQVLVYYELYDDGTYGYFAPNQGTLPGLRSDNDPDSVIMDSGYGVLTNEPGSIRLGTAAPLPPVDVPPGSPPLVLCIIPPEAIPVASSLIPTAVSFINSVAEVPLGYIHQNFARAVYPASQVVPPLTFFIRTPQQMINISDVITETLYITFTQERSLDFTGISLPDGAVVVGDFLGMFEVELVTPSLTIGSVTIDAEGAVPAIDDVGLFTINSGTISGINLIPGLNPPGTSITGDLRVGGIAGTNEVGATIENCTIQGDPVDGTGMHITGSTSPPIGPGFGSVGGIAGLNNGTIENCTVENTTGTITGPENVGGIAGVNAATGVIEDVFVTNVRLASNGTGTSIGSIVGFNDGDVINPTPTDVIDGSGNPITKESGNDPADSLDTDTGSAPDVDTDTGSAPDVDTDTGSAPDLDTDTDSTPDFNDAQCDCIDCDCTDCDCGVCDCDVCDGVDCDDCDVCDCTDDITGAVGAVDPDIDYDNDNCPDCDIGSCTDCDISICPDCIDNCDCTDDSTMSMAIPIIGAVVAGPAIAGTITKLNSRMARGRHKKTRGRK